MGKTITLTEQEVTLRQLLLDVSDYIGTLEGCTKPELRITGGWVRDKLLGTQSMDIDIGIDTMTGFRFGNLMKQYLAQPETQSKYHKAVLGGLAKIEANPEKSKHLETVNTRILGLTSTWSIFVRKRMSKIAVTRLWNSGPQKRMLSVEMLP